MCKCLERETLYCSATDCHFWQEICKANDRTPKVISWSCWLCDVWCAQCEEKVMWEQNGKKISGITVTTVRNWSSSSWLLQNTGAPCATASLPPLMVGTAQKGHPEGAGLNGSSLRTGHRTRSHQSLCRLPAGRFSYANGFFPCNKESSC